MSLGQRLYDLRKKDVLIGRGQNSDIQINLDTISSEHARIHLTSRGWALAASKPVISWKMLKTNSIAKLLIGLIFGIFFALFAIRVSPLKFLCAEAV